MYCAVPFCLKYLLEKKKEKLDRSFLQEGDHDEDQSLYSRFYITGRDIAAFFTDSASENHDCSSFAPLGDCDPSGTPVESIDNISSLVDRCGMAVIVDQVYFLLYI